MRYIRKHRNGLLIVPQNGRGSRSTASYNLFNSMDKFYNWGPIGNINTVDAKMPPKVFTSRLNDKVPKVRYVSRQPVSDSKLLHTKL